MPPVFSAVTSAAGVRNATSVTFGHTCSGSGVTLVVFSGSNRVGGQECTGVTYNGVAMTRVDGFVFGSNSSLTAWVLYIGTGDGTSHNVGVTGTSGSVSVVGVAMSFTGSAAVQTGAHNHSNAVNAAPAVSVTTTQNNSLLAGGFFFNQTVASANFTPTSPLITRITQDSDASTGQSYAGVSRSALISGATNSAGTATSDSWGALAVEIFGSADIGNGAAMLLDLI